MVDRLRQLIPEGMGKVYAERASVDETTLSRWRAGSVRPNPKLDTLQRLAAALRVPLAHLISDDGPPAGHVEEKGEDYATLPVLAEVSAGVPRFAPADQDPLRLAFRRRWLEHLVGPDISPRHVFLARVKGDSMHPGIRDKDVVLLERWYPPTAERPRKELLANGKIYLVAEKDGDGLTLKRLALAGSTLTVYADNPSYAPYSIDLEETPLHRIVLGRVRWLGRKED